jgi:hypothetical protein
MNFKLIILYFIFFSKSFSQNSNHALDKNSVQIWDQFFYCHESKLSEPINLDFLCHNDFIDLAETDVFKLDIEEYQQVEFGLMGMGYECRVLVNAPFSKKRVVFLSALECEIMFHNKTCKQSDNTYEKMTCDLTSNDCEFKKTNFLAGFTECSLKIHNLKAFSKQERILGQNCTALDYFCKLESSVLVWFPDIIKNSPLRFVTKRKLYSKIENEKITHVGEDSSHMEEFETFSDCNSNFLKTKVTGLIFLYINAFDKNRSKIEKINSEIYYPNYEACTKFRKNLIDYTKFTDAFSSRLNIHFFGHKLKKLCLYTREEKVREERA